MTRNEFIERANYTAPVLTAGVHWNPDYAARGSRSRWSCRRHGYWHQCAPIGARCAYPSGLPEHGPRACAPGTYAEAAA